MCRRIYETWDIMAQMEESSVIAFGRILRDVRPDIYERPLSQGKQIGYCYSCCNIIYIILQPNSIESY